MAKHLLRGGISYSGFCCDRLVNHYPITLCVIVALQFVTMNMGVAQNRVTNLKRHLKEYSVNRILSDPKDFLWVATENGLVRFDGSSLKNYVHDPNNPHSLGGNYVRDMLRDKEGKLWLATANAGLSYFDPKLPESQAFTNYRANIDNPKALISNELYAIEMDDAGMIWLGGNEGHLVQFDPKTGLCKRFDDNLRSPDTGIFALYYAGNGQLFVGTRDKGLVLFDTKREQITQRWLFKDLISRNFYGTNGITNFCFDKKRQVLWFASLPLGLAGLDMTTHQIIYNTNFNIPPIPQTNYTNWQHACSVSLDAGNNIWVGYKKDSVFVFNPDTKKVIRNITSESPTAKKAPLFCLNDIKYDSVQNCMWLITSSGLFSFNPQTNPLTQFTPLSISGAKSEKLPTHIKHSDDGLMWMVVGSQLKVIDPRNGALVQTYNLPISGENINILKISPTHVYILGNSAFWVLDRKTTQFQKVKTGLDATEVMEDRGNNNEPIVWLSTYGKGLYRFSKNFGQMDSFFTNLKIIGIQFDSSKNLWLCTDGQGAWRINDKDKCTYKTFQNDPSVQSGSLPENVIIRAYLDKKGRLWLGSMSTGLVLVENPNSDKPNFRAFPLSPIGSPAIMDFREDADGLLWLLGSDNKWYLFNPDTHESMVMNPGDDMLPDIDFSKMSLVQGQKGIWAVTTEGVRLLDNSSSFSKQKKLRVQFMDFQIFERNASERLLLPEIRLSPKENYFTLSFSAPDFEHPTRIRYFYKLDGFDNDWVNSGTRKEVNYNNLDGGTYTFRVRAVYGNDNPKEAEESTLTIVVEPHFWKAWWFRLLLVLAIGAAVYAFLRLRINAVRHEAELKTEFNNRLAEARISALRAQMNPHFIFNCLNTIEGFVLENKKWEASVFLQKFSKLIRLVLENAQYSTIPLEQDLDALRMYVDLEKVRYEGIFDAKIVADEALLEKPIPPMLLQPFVENAILHGLRHRNTEGGHLKVIVQQKDAQHIECIIEDNGIGRTNAALLHQQKENLHKTSLGMKFTEERLRFFADTAVMTIEDAFPNEKNCGTRVRIVLPMN